jgi:glycosyltransferase involved in cell wall biosynthesis
LVVGIDASRNRSGGAKAHLVGILREADPAAHGIKEVHVWSYRELLAALPTAPWLIKHNPPAVQRSLPHQLWWQWRRLPLEARHVGCSVMLNTDAGTICGFSPAATMSRDMLSYEPGESRRYGLTKARLRLAALRYVQSRSLRKSEGAIFLTQYAARVIQRHTGPLANVAVIPHGVGSDFKASEGGAWDAAEGRTIRCLYVSNAAMYKHQWNVVRAVGELRKRGHDVSLLLAGGGSGHAQRLLDAEIAVTDPARTFVSTAGALRHDEIPPLLANADIFVFASSCENMPNALVEAMASGLPIACSNRGPMPEILEDAGVYFDPEDPVTIAKAIEDIIRDRELRMRIARSAKRLSEQYSWSRCARETLDFIRHTARLL